MFRIARSYLALLSEAIIWAFLPSLKMGTALGSGVWFVLGVFLARSLAKERGWFDMTISNPAYEPAIIAICAFIFLFSARLIAAPFVLWKKERDKVAALQTKQVFREALSSLADNLPKAREMLNRKIESDEQLSQLGSDYNEWNRKVVEEIADSISIAAAKTYAAAPTPMAAAFTGSFNNSHNDLRLHINSCFKRLSELISRFDRDRQ